MMETQSCPNLHNHHKGGVCQYCAATFRSSVPVTGPVAYFQPGMMYPANAPVNPFPDANNPFVEFPMLNAGSYGIGLQPPPGSTPINPAPINAGPQHRNSGYYQQGPGPVVHQPQQPVSQNSKNHPQRALPNPPAQVQPMPVMHTPGKPGPGQAYAIPVQQKPVQHVQHMPIQGHVQHMPGPPGNAMPGHSPQHQTPHIGQPAMPGQYPVHSQQHPMHGQPPNHVVQPHVYQNSQSHNPIQQPIQMPPGQHPAPGQYPVQPAQHPAQPAQGQIPLLNPVQPVQGQQPPPSPGHQNYTSGSEPSDGSNLNLSAPISSNSKGSLQHNSGKTLHIPPQYQRFRYIFETTNEKNNSVLLDLQVTHKLNKAMAKRESQPKESVTEITIERRKHIFDLDAFKFWPKDNQSLIKSFNVLESFDKWYYEDADGCVKLYNVETLAVFKTAGQIFRVKIGKHEYEINLKTKIQKNVKTSKERKIYSQEDIEKIRHWDFDFPDYKTFTPANGNSELRELNDQDPEYKRVAAYFRMYMPNEEKITSVLQSQLAGRTTKAVNRITKISKIFNPKLRAKWFEHYSDIKEINKDNPSCQLTRLLWHGSGETKPSIIYDDFRFGWKINYSSQKNLWGNGLYFGEDAHYCHKYVYRTPEGRKQMFLAEVIVGDDIISLEDDSIREPWLKEDGKTRYDSVCGVRHDKSWIWVVYASGTAYPGYLVEYSDE